MNSISEETFTKPFHISMEEYDNSIFVVAGRK